MLLNAVEISADFVGIVLPVLGPSLRAFKDIMKQKLPVPLARMVAAQLI